MVASKFITILQKKEHIQQVETTELKAIVEKYPYFQAARSLYLKGLKNNDSFKYNTELKITASQTTDRTILFNYITSTNFNTQKENIHQQTNGNNELDLTNWTTKMCSFGVYFHD